MAAATRPSPEPGVRRQGNATELLRFDRGERVLHWVNATLFAVMMATAAALYVGPISAQVGRRELVKTVHVYTGLALPFPIVATIALRRWGAALRADIRRLNRFSADDRRWLRTLGRDPMVRNGKFNAGQKLNAAFTVGAILVMLATGSIMRWPQSFALSWRTGATFVHDWIFIGLVFTISGHVMFAMKDSEVRRGMLGGWVGAWWARRHAPRWFEDVTGEPATPPKGRAASTGSARPGGTTTRP
jgi:formate dehydrogenase subunit gamma